MVSSLHSPEKLKFTQEDGRELTEAVHRLFDFLQRYTLMITSLQGQKIKFSTALSDCTTVWGVGCVNVPELRKIEEKFFAIIAKNIDGRRG